MSRIKNLELLYNIQQKNLKSREDCIVVALHCLLIKKNLLCTGVGETWSDDSRTTELLPENWNSNQDVYTLRYITKDRQTRLLLKVTKMEHMLQVDVTKNEDFVASTSFPVDNVVANDFGEYSSTYKDLEALKRYFYEDVLEKLRDDTCGPSSSKMTNKRVHRGSSPMPSAPPRPSRDLKPARGPSPPFKFPEVGGSDLDATGQGRGGGMLVDPASLTSPRPTVPEGQNIPKGSVPHGARFDPIKPPDPDKHKKPPASDESDDSD